MYVKGASSAEEAAADRRRGRRRPRRAARSPAPRQQRHAPAAHRAPADLLDERPDLVVTFLVETLRAADWATTHLDEVRAHPAARDALGRRRRGRGVPRRLPPLAAPRPVRRAARRCSSCRRTSCSSTASSPPTSTCDAGPTMRRWPRRAPSSRRGSVPDELGVRSGPCRRVPSPSGVAARRRHRPAPRPVHRLRPPRPGRAGRRSGRVLAACSCRTTRAATSRGSPATGARPRGAHGCGSSPSSSRASPPRCTRPSWRSASSASSTIGWRGSWRSTPRSPSSARSVTSWMGDDRLARA